MQSHSRSSFSLSTRAVLEHEQEFMWYEHVLYSSARCLYMYYFHWLVDPSKNFNSKKFLNYVFTKTEIMRRVHRRSGTAAHASVSRPTSCCDRSIGTDIDLRRNVRIPLKQINSFFFFFWGVWWGYILHTPVNPRVLLTIVATIMEFDRVLISWQPITGHAASVFSIAEDPHHRFRVLPAVYGGFMLL